MKFYRVPQFKINTGLVQDKTHSLYYVHGRIKAWEIFHNISLAFLIFKYYKESETYGIVNVDCCSST